MRSFVFVNSLCPPIKWTIEKEKEGKFHVFDLQLIQMGTKVDTTVHRKPSASYRYLHYKYMSAQAWHEKTTAIHLLTLYALNYCSKKKVS